MPESPLYTHYLNDLAGWFEALPDKPEETRESTLKALWLTASGTPVSAERATKQSTLPELHNAAIEQLEVLLQQRRAGTPLAHLTGRQHFFGIEMLSSKQALVPRKETEILAQAALDCLKKLNHSAPLIIDVCTGCGNLALAIAFQSEQFRVYASDLSEEAVALAKKNVDFLGLAEQVQIRQGDLIEAFREGTFENQVDLLTCNPPYISTAKVGQMHEEISRHEPSLAFDGGAFGIKILHRLVKVAPDLLKPGGFLAFEVGRGQGAAMKTRLEKSGVFARVHSCSDANGDIRVLVAEKIGY